MKKTAVVLLSALIALAASGCSKLQKKEEKPVTSLTLMEEVNRSNIVSTQNRNRIWYEVDPSYFADGGGSQSGDFNGILARISYLSDNDFTTQDDLNMSGLLLMNAVLEDDAQAVVDPKMLNPDYGTQEDLSRLCQQAAAVDIPVMMRLNLRAVSKNSESFTALEQYVSGLDPAASLDQFDPGFRQEFNIDKDREEENWIRIGSSPWFYQAIPSTDTPMANLDSDLWKNRITEAVDYYLSLGISGFFLEGTDSLFNGDTARIRDYINWLAGMVRERKPDAYIAAGAAAWNDDMKQMQTSLLDNASIGIQGMLAKAVTGSVSARDLGNYITEADARGENAWKLSDGAGSLDLLKTEAKLPQYKMLLALAMMMSGQVFLSAGDELALSNTSFDMISEAIDIPGEIPDPAFTAEEGEETGKTLENAGENPDSEAGLAEKTEKMDEELVFEFGNLAEQREDGNSVFQFLQQAVFLRASYSSISSGKTEMVDSLSTDSVLFLDKSTDKSHCIVVFNLSDGKTSSDLSSLSISGLPPELGGILLTGTESASLENGILELPPYSCAVLK